MFALPELFARMCKEGAFSRTRGSWLLKEEVDFFGNALETELGEVFCTGEMRARETARLPACFETDGDYGESRVDLRNPGTIPDIVDFEKILVFAISSDGAPFCFDFRESEVEPSVIWWDDIYWRLLAPNFAAFVSLFEFGGDGQHASV